MCQCNLITEQSTGQTIDISCMPYRLRITTETGTHILLDKIPMTGRINHAACYEIEKQHGFKRGYMLIIGEQDEISS